MTPDDAQVQPESETLAPDQTTPAAPATQEQTADGTTEAEPEWNPDSLPRDAQGRFSKWFEREKATYLRQEQTRNGNKLMGVPDPDKEKLRRDPLYIQRIESQLEEARRHVGASSVQQQVSQAKPEVDDAEVEAQEFLRSQGYTGKEEGYEGILAYEVAREKRTQARIAKAIEKAKPDSKALAETVRKEDRDAVWREEFSEVVKSNEWNDPEKGETFEGKFWRKVREIGKTRRWVPPSVLVAEIKAEMTPTPKPVSKPRPQMGESPSGRAGAPAETDHFKSFDEAARAAGVDPTRF